MRYLVLLLGFFVFVGCFDDKYVVDVYDKNIIKQTFPCLKLHLEPYSYESFEVAKDLYNFNNSCEYELQIRYKTNIACNSSFNTHKEFDGFINFILLKDNKLILSVYKDLTNKDNIKDEIKKGYKRLCKIIKL